MNESATLADGSSSHTLRERRKQQTRSTLVRLARKFTDEHGLGGFTLDELCDSAGISRRTFFNHFASKDDAVLGMPKCSPFLPYKDEFISSKGTLTLAEAITQLTADSLDSMISGELAPEKLMAVIHREPSLLNRMRQNGFRAGAEVEKLICEREGLEYPNAYANTVAFVMHHLTMSSVAPLPQSESEVLHPPKMARDRESFITQFTSQLNHLTAFLTEGKTTP